MTSNQASPLYNEPCKECGSQLFIPIDSYVLQDEDKGWVDGNVHKDRVGHKCAECGHIVLTREIPQRHADDTNLEYPEKADRDMVRE